MHGVKDAQVTYIPVDDKNSILTKIQDTSASVLLTVDDNFKIETAKTIAEMVASVIGNETTEKSRLLTRTVTFFLEENKTYMREALIPTKILKKDFVIISLIISIWV